MSPVACGVYLLSLLLFLSSPGCLAQWRQIYIDPINGSNTTNCLVSNSSHQPCRNLSYAIEHNHTTNWIEYVLSPGRHYFGINITFRGLQGVAITGSENASTNTTIECSAHNAGFAFIRVSGIMLKKVTFHQCASLQDSTSQNFSTSGIILSKTQVALYFYLCQNVNMSSVNVTESPNATGVVMYDTTGTNTMEDCYFIRNSVNGTPPYSGGGGFYLEFSYCKPGDNNCTDDEGPYIPSEFNSHSVYTFLHCFFIHNIANSLDSEASTYLLIPYRTKHVAFGRGGGLSIFINGNASNNTILISECVFQSNNALWGGGLFVEFHDTAAGNNITVISSLISDNHCFYKDSGGTAGGGMRIGQYVFKAGVQGYGGNNVALQGCNFTTNRGLKGGGLSISPVLQVSDPASVTIDDCYFEGNIACLGAAVHVSRFSTIRNGMPLTVQFSRCTFTNNSVAYSDQTNYQVGVGALYINAVPVYFRNTNSFTFNNASAIGVVATHLDFTNSTSIFVSNTAHVGGAIALLGAALLLINDGTRLLFSNNSAHVSGGAIYNKYIEQENLLTFRYNCFIRHENYLLAPYAWKSYFIFKGNTDGLHGGNSIHSTSILPCAWAGEDNETSHILCWNNKWVFRNSSGYKVNCSEEISSDAGSIDNTNQLPVQAIPGKMFRLPLEVKDDLGHDISDLTVFIAPPGSMAVAMIESYMHVAVETLQVRGIQNQSFPLHFDTTGDRALHVEVQVELQMCPPGFVPSSTTANSKCECATHNYNGVVVCDQTAFNASLANGYWMGASPYHDGTLVVAQCPSGFCYTNPNSSFFSLPNSTDDLDAQICGRVHRTGIMCGECENGYGPAVNSKTFDCVLCNNTNLAANNAYYLLSVYLPLLVLFIVIIIFNIRLTTGPANSFILYSQLVSSTFDLNADGRIPLNLVTPHYDRLLKAYQLPYGIFNLNFFEQFVKPLCVGTHLNVLDVLELQYGVALFPLLMIVIVVLFIKLKKFVLVKCVNRARTRSRAQSRLPGKWRMGDSLVHAFAAFLLLSYTKFSITSSYIVGVEPLLDDKGNQIGPRRVYYEGQLASTNSTYILWYLLPSVIVLTIFVVIPPLLLLGYPVKLLEMGINKVDWLQRVYPADKVQILLDTFQGCYKNNMRFFAGVYFLFRLASNVIYAVTDTYLEQFISQQIICTLIIVMLALCQPYRDEKKIFNYVDILIFTNLAVVNAFGAYLYEYSLSNPGQELPLSVFVLQYILVFLPLIYMLTYIIWYRTTPYHQPLLSDYLRGVDIVNQTFLTYSGKAYSFHWEKHGFKIHFPENALPPGMSECHISITASISGQYLFPDDSELVSGIYWIACPVRFTRPVTLEIQYCSTRTEPDEYQLCFVTAKCTQENLPYIFRVLESGAFSSATFYGSIQLTGFSGKGIICRRCRRTVVPYPLRRPSRVVPVSEPERASYCGLLYYSLPCSVTAGVKRWKAYFVICSLRLDILITAMDKTYSGYARQTDLEVQFGEEKITLNLHTERIKVKEWTVVHASRPPVITKKQVDSYKPGTTARIPSCQLIMEWKSRKKPISVLHEVELEGTQDHNTFILELPPPGLSDTQQLPLSPNQPASPQVVTLTAAKAVDVLKDSGFLPSSWQGLASRVGISDPDSIATQKPNDSLRLQETVHQWLQNDLEASWYKLANEVSRIEGYGPRIRQNVLTNAGSSCPVRQY